MTDLADPVAPPVASNAIRSNPRVEMRDLLPVLRARTIHAMLLTFLVVAQYWFQLAPGLGQHSRVWLEAFVGMFVWNVGYYVVAFLIIAVVQARLSPGRARTLTLLCTMLVWVLIWQLWESQANSELIVVKLGLVSSAGVKMAGLWTNLTYSLLAAWYYESIDRAARSAAIMRGRELAREGAERWLLELRLGALQARLDPQVLFDTLDGAERLYRRQPVAAEALLDSLIDYLRLAVALPGQAESTFSREVELAVAYLRLLRGPDGNLLELAFNVAGTVVDARFPPMVVHPLCDALARSTLASGLPARMSIFATREGESAGLRITAKSTRTAVASKHLEDVRRTLLAMFGPAVRIDATGPSAGEVNILVEVPYDASPRIDR